MSKFIDYPLYMSAVDHTIGRDSISRRIVAMVVIETLYQALISHSPQDFSDMLVATMNSFEINSELHR